MRRAVRIGIYSAVAALVSAASAAGQPSQTARFAEFLRILPTATEPVTSAPLKAGHRYEITVSGTVSDWCGEDAQRIEDCDFGGYQGKFEKRTGVDALYCYTTWRCPKPTLWRQLQIDGQGFDVLAGKAGKIPYSSSHTYKAVVQGISGRLSFLSSDSSPGNDSGYWTVLIRDLGPAARTIRYHFLGRFEDGEETASALESVNIGGTGNFKIIPESAGDHVRTDKIFEYGKGKIVMEFHGRSGKAAEVEFRVETARYGRISSEQFVRLTAEVVSSSIRCAHRGQSYRFEAYDQPKAAGDAVAFDVCGADEGRFTDDSEVVGISGP
jgi:hypothetical protein